MTRTAECLTKNAEFPANLVQLGELNNEAGAVLEPPSGMAARHRRSFGVSTLFSSHPDCNRICESCGVEFIVTASRTRRNLGRFCSRECAATDRRTPASDRFWRRVDKSGPIPEHAPHLGNCWIWLGSSNDEGYGQIKANGRSAYTHRLSYELLVGPIPQGKVLDHLCRVRQCVNPSHLEPVTDGINFLRSLHSNAITFRTNVCKRGHLMEGVNLYVSPGGRRNCRECQKIRKAKFDAR